MQNYKTETAIAKISDCHSEMFKICLVQCSSSSTGRASASRAECCEFESRLLFQSYCGYNDNNSTLPIIFEVRKSTANTH